MIMLNFKCQANLVKVIFKLLNNFDLVFCLHRNIITLWFKVEYLSNESFGDSKRLVLTSAVYSNNIITLELLHFKFPNQYSFN